MLGLLLLLAPVSVSADPTLRDVEQAFVLLEEPKGHRRAHLLLERATAAFNDVDLDGSDLEKAFASDAKKPWRGRPHERVLAQVALAALDIERGRCDLALPALSAAAFFDARARGDRSDAVVVHALRLRCLIDEGAAQSDVDEARKDLRDAGADGRVEALALHPRARLAFVGRGPRYVRSGSHGEGVVAVSRDGEGDVEGGVVRLSKGSPLRLRGRVDSAVVYDTFVEATSARGRPFDEILARRAQRKAQNEGAARANLDESARRLRSSRDVVGAAAYAGFGVGFSALAAVNDARADDRFVDSLPGRIVLIAPAE